MGKLWESIPDGVDAQGHASEKAIEVDLSQLRITEPTVFFLSGMLTFDRSTDFANATMRLVKELLKNCPELPKEPKTYCWSHSGLRNIFNLAAYAAMPGSRSSKAGYDLGRGILMPLVTKDFVVDAKGDVTGSPLSAEEAKKNLKNVTFFGYSAGTMVAQEMYNATLKMMKSIGYTAETARELLSEIALVSVGVTSRQSKELNRFTTVYIVATNDLIPRLKNWLFSLRGTFVRALFGRYLKRSKPLTIRPLSKTSVIVSAPVRSYIFENLLDTLKKDKDKKRKQKKLEELRKKHKWWKIGNNTHHELEHYLTKYERDNALANVAMYAMLNATQRTGRLDPMQMIEATPGDSPKKKFYREKIAAAVAPIPKALAKQMKY